MQTVSNMTIMIGTFSFRLFILAASNLSICVGFSNLFSSLDTSNIKCAPNSLETIHRSSSSRSSRRKKPHHHNFMENVTYHGDQIGNMLSELTKRSTINHDCRSDKLGTKKRTIYTQFIDF